MEINFRSLDLNLLRVFLAVWTCGSISGAADQLGLSQPATSNALARLRRATGDQLFTRTKQGMVPTAFALQVLPVVEHHFNGLLNSLEGHGTFEPAQSARRFNLSLSGVGELVFLPRLLQRLLATAPGVGLCNLATPSEEMQQGLARGSLDLALGLLDVKGPGLQSHDLFRDRYVAVAGRGLATDPASIDDLRQQRIALSVPGGSYAQDMDKLIPKYGLAENVQVRLAHFDALVPVLTEFPFVSFLPALFTKQLQASAGIRILPVAIEEDIQSAVRLVWHNRTGTDPACTWLRKLIIDEFAQS